LLWKKYKISLVLLLSLDDSRTTWSKCLEKTRWSSSLDLSTYLYYFTSGYVSIITQSHVFLEHSMVTCSCYMIWLPNFPCYLYLDPIIWLDIRDQMFECIGGSFLSETLITSRLLLHSLPKILTFTHHDKSSTGKYS